MAKTFTDSKGVVRPVKAPAKPAKKAVPPKANPLDAAVNSAIQGQIKPYQAANTERQTQYTQDVADSAGVDSSLQAQLAQIRAGLDSSNANALGLAASRGSAVPDQMQRNQSFLRDVLGNYTTNGGTGLDTAASQQGVISNANASGNAAAVGLAGSSGASQLAAQSGAAGMAGRERGTQLLQARLADQRAIQNQIAAIKATAPALRREYQNQDFDRYTLAAGELGLSASAQAEQKRQFDASLAAGTAAAAADAKPAAPKSKYGFGISGQYDKDLDSLYSTIANKVVPQIGSDQKPTGQNVANPARKWRDVVSKLTGLGIPGGQAVLLASKWLPERLSIHGKSSPAVIYKLLKSGELGFKLSDAVARQVLSNIGPNAWAQRNANPRAVTIPVRPGKPGTTVGAGDLGGGALNAGDLAAGGFTF